MAYLQQLIDNYSVATVFLSVLLEQAGIPVPAYPTLMLAGSGVEKTGHSPLTLLLVAMAAALIADLAWYYAGRRHGKKMIALLSRISMFTRPGATQTTGVLFGWHTYALLIAKFIPGFSTAAGAVAGNLGIRLPVFVLFDLAGTGLWAGSALFLGVEFGADISQLLEVLSSLGTSSLMLIAAVLICYVASRLWRRRRNVPFLKSSQVPVK